MANAKLLDASTIDFIVTDIISTLKADVKTLDGKFDETDEYHYYKDSQDLEKLIQQLERVTDNICGIVREYRP